MAQIAIMHFSLFAIAGLPVILGSILWLQRHLPAARKRRARVQAGAGTAVLIVVLGIGFASPHLKITKCLDARDYHACAIISLTGDIAASDGDEFIKRTEDVASARIDLTSTGGNLLAGLEIGEQIHARGFDTYVPAKTICASACADIWLAGKVREMGPDTLLIWHVAFRADDPQNADGAANIATGVYLAHLGFNYADALRMFGHDPSYVHATYSNAQGQQSRKDLHWDGVKFVPVGGGG
jgi:hypothetical protein